MRGVGADQLGGQTWTLADRAVSGRGFRRRDAGVWGSYLSGAGPSASGRCGFVSDLVGAVCLGKWHHPRPSDPGPVLHAVFGAALRCARVTCFARAAVEGVRSHRAGFVAGRCLRRRAPGRRSGISAPRTGGIAARGTARPSGMARHVHNQRRLWCVPARSAPPAGRSAGDVGDRTRFELYAQPAVGQRQCR